jgi:hypothetical protein
MSISATKKHRPDCIWSTTDAALPKVWGRPFCPPDGPQVGDGLRPLSVSLRKKNSVVCDLATLQGELPPQRPREEAMFGVEKCETTIFISELVAIPPRSPTPGFPGGPRRKAWKPTTKKSPSSGGAIQSLPTHPATWGPTRRGQTRRTLPLFPIARPPCLPGSSGRVL